MAKISSSSLAESESDTDVNEVVFPLPPLLTLFPFPEYLPLLGRRTDRVPFLLLPDIRRTGVDIGSSSSSDVFDDSLSSSFSVL